MRRNVKEIAASAVALSVVGYVVWPLGDVPWRWIAYVPESLNGDLAVAVLAVLATAGVGFAITAATGVRLSNLALGGGLAYTVWMAVLTLGVSFHEPLLPVIAYGLVFVGVLLGAVVGTAFDREPVGENHARLS